MRVVVVGASGNVGTALLRRLRDDETVTSVAGVVRRVPQGPPPAPYDTVEWSAADVGARGPDAPVVRRLAALFAGADAVVDLAWLIQPSHDRDALRRVNVDGMRRVVAAVVEARVPHLVVASSVGAYSPSYGDEPRDESWDTAGVRSSDYSVDKVAVERLLDEAELRHPALTIARLRPALVFQHAAGHEIQRYFLGPFVPGWLLGNRLPVLPWPAGFRLQAVHADDLADAFREAVVRQAAGPFNVAGPGVIRAADVADVVSRGRWREVPHAPVRAAMSAGWHARVVPVGPGWFDMGASAPVMDTSRAERELGFRPRYPGVQAMRQLVAGIVRGAGTASPPMRPR
ncbi:NAD-dependent epimerase/dehydratase family protein [Cellulomonas sp. ES6]|uniref:NAD-dependent epimerase/dehydratase family protein n=1 Tax=Cellulomonas sp. ES6 TaxID=3039384 RepID=UPI0024B6EE31|nr:NAD-dependent epimerase/dehydratase family protein [Cellulomonas sp. ES6]WHP17146.1 NAD-dependent epimerase/dehydratase family protein [Cellulomonas sp. ES6]